MFKRLKQKIESESEGEQSPVPKNDRGRGKRSAEAPLRAETPEEPGLVKRNGGSIKTTEDNGTEQTPTSQHVIARVHQLLEAGRAQNDTASVPKAESTPTSEKPQSDTTVNPGITPQSPSKLANKPDDSEPGEKYDAATKEELLALAKKQEKALTRYKTKFSEVVDAYKNLQKENEKLQFNLGQSQDKQIRKVSELKETIELEKKAKMHIEDSLRVAMEEKDDLINVLKTQINFLKTNKTDNVPDETGELGDEVDNKPVLNAEKIQLVDKIKELEATIDIQAKQIAELQENESSSVVHRQEFTRSIERLQLEKQTAIQEMMSNVENIMDEKNKCDIEIKNLSEELQVTKVLLEDTKNQKDDIVQKMDKRLEEREISENNKLAKLRDEHEASVRSMISDHENIVEELKRSKAKAIELVKKQQEKYTADVLAAKEDEHKHALQGRQKQLDTLLSQKEGDLKAAYSEKVKEVELAVEEQELQKHAVVKRKFEEMSKLESRIQELEEQLQEKDTMSNDLQTTKDELVEVQKKNKEDQENLQKQQRDLEKTVQKQESEIKKQEEDNKNLVSKVKALQEKITDMTASVKKSEQAAAQQNKLRKTEEEKHKKQLQETIKEHEGKKQGELAAVSKKSEGKVIEMKKIVKELRNKLSTKEKQVLELQEKMNKTTTTETKEREEILKRTECQVNEMQATIDSLKVELHERENEVKRLNVQLTTVQREGEDKEKLLATEHGETVKIQQDEIQRLKQQLEEKMDCCSEFEEKIVGLTSDNKMMISKLQNEHKMQVQGLNEKFQETLDEHKKIVEEEKNNQQIRISKDAEMKVKEMKKIVNELRGSLTESESREESLKLSLEKEKNSLKSLEKQLGDKHETLQQLNIELQGYECKAKELKSQITTLNQDRETAFKEKEAEKVVWTKEIESKFNEKLKEKDDFLKSTIEQLTKQNELNYDDIAQNYEAMKEEQMRSLQERHEAQMNELNSVHERALIFCRKEADESYEKLASEAKDREEQLSRKIEGLRTSSEKKKEEYERVREQLAENVSALTVEVNVKSRKVDELQASKEQLEKDVSELKQNMDDKMLELIEQHRQEMNKFEQESEHHFELMSVEQSGIIEAQTREMNEMKNRLEANAERMTVEHSTQLSEMKDSYESKYCDSLNTLQNENTQLKELLEKRQHEAEKEDSKRTESYQILETKYSDIVVEHKELFSEKNKLNNELECLKGERDEALSAYARVEETLKILETKHLDSVEALEKDMKEVNIAKDDIENQLSASQDTVKQLQTKIQEEQLLHEKEKGRVMEESDAKYIEIEKELSDRTRTLDDILKRIQSESEMEIKELKENVSHLEVKIKELLTEHEAEVEGYKKNAVTLRKKIKALSEESKNKTAQIVDMKDEYEKNILGMQKQEENLKMEIASSKHDSQTIDEQVKRLLTEKQELQTQLNASEEKHRHEMREANEKSQELIANLENEMFSKQEELNTRITELEKDKRDSLENLKDTLAVESKQKVLDLKKKAETKIASLRKQLTKQLEEQRKELSEAKDNIKKLETQLEKQQVSHSENLQRVVVEHEAIVKTKVEEVECQKGEIEMSTKSMEEKIAQLEASEVSLVETVENVRIEKMEALREQSLSLNEDHRLEIDKLLVEHQQKTDLLEKRLLAKVEEKDYEYNSKIKQVVKEFQAKLSAKDQEIQDTLAHTIENRQKEEEQLALKYEEEIVELKKELKYREDEMMQMQKDNEDMLVKKEAEMAELMEKHEKTLVDTELDYRSRIEELHAQHERELKGIDQNEQLIEIEKKYEAELEKARKGHSSELLALEKKLKNQMKKNQSEMKKLLNAKEAEYEKRNNPVTDSNSEDSKDNVDVLKATIDRLNREMDLLREKEILLKDETELHVENGVRTPERHTELNLTSNPFSANSPGSPSHPGETEYEYLRNVLFQYMMGKQRKQLSKVLATIVRFTPSQYQQIIQKEEERDGAKGGLFSPYRS